MEKYKVNVSEYAENDIYDIVRYITSQLAAPIAAMDMMDLLEAAMAGLSVMPERFPLIDDERLSQMGYRTRIVKKYIVFFIINEKDKVVDVERILYGRRDWRQLIILN
jgi:plasmid stabilization system protein ParE